MVAIPPWFIGKHLTAIAATPMVAAPNGVLTADTSAQTLVGILEEVSISPENLTETIQALDVRRENDVIVGSRTEVSLVEILQIAKYLGNPNSAYNILAAIGMTYDYIYVALTRGGQSWAGYFLIRRYAEGLMRGKSVGRLDLGYVDPGVANPTYTF